MKLVATDLDGTLLNDHHQISEENKRAIKKAQKHGVQVAVATGRSFKAANKPLQDAGITCPIICLNGAQIYTNDHKLIKAVPLSMNVAVRIKKACQKEDVYFELFTNKGGFSDSRDKFLAVIIDIITSANPEVSEDDIRARASMRFQDEDITIVDDYDSVFEQKDMDIYKVLAFSVEHEKLIRVKDDLANETRVKITSSGLDNLEFNNPEAQKGNALEFLAGRLGFKMDQVMAIGDNYNDLSMLIGAGRGVAMGNADDNIKKQCGYVTKTNLENGVAHAIEEMLKECYE